MPSFSPESERGRALCRRLVRSAGALIARSARRGFRISKKGAINLVTSVDLAAEKKIVSGLRASFPEAGILAEESGSHAVMGGQGRFVIDPLDGTTNFAHGIPHCAVSLAYEKEGRTLLGMVYNPFLDEFFEAGIGKGAWLGGKRLRVSETSRLGESLLSTGFSYKPSEIRANLNRFRRLVLMARGIRRPGSAALDLAYVAAGRFDGFWEIGLHLWDVAAGRLLITEAGGRISDLAGRDNPVDAGNMVASNGRIHKALLRALAAASLLIVLASGGWAQEGMGLQSLFRLKPTATATPSASPTASRTPRPSRTPSATSTVTLTESPTASPTWSPTATVTLTWTPTATWTPTFTNSPTPAAEISISPSFLVASKPTDFSLAVTVRGATEVSEIEIRVPLGWKRPEKLRSSRAEARIRLESGFIRVLYKNPLKPGEGDLVQWLAEPPDLFGGDPWTTTLNGREEYKAQDPRGRDPMVRLTSATASATPSPTSTATRTSSPTPTPRSWALKQAAVVPNPVRGDGFELYVKAGTGIARLRFRLYTPSQRKILEQEWSPRSSLDFEKIAFRALDGDGRPLANGTYRYVLEALAGGDTVDRIEGSLFILR